jgi:hypothetical protein
MSRDAADAARVLVRKSLSHKRRWRPQGFAANLRSRKGVGEDQPRAGLRREFAAVVEQEQRKKLLGLGLRLVIMGSLVLCGGSR